MQSVEKSIGMFKQKKIPVALNSPFRKKDTDKRLNYIGKNIPVF
jgi:hypothetical protein